MKVRDLIERLSELDPDLPLMMPSEDVTDFCPIDGAILDTIVTIGGVMNLADERDADLEVVVRLIGPYSDPVDLIEDEDEPRLVQ